MHSRGKMFDALLEMHGVGVMAAGAGTASTPVDLGLGAPMRGGIPFPVGYTEGKLVIYLTAVSTGATDFGSKFEIWLQGSHDATFTTWQGLFAVKLGVRATFSTMWPNPYVSATSPGWYSNLATWPGPVALPVRISLPFCNDFGGITYRWLRVYTAIAASAGTGINYYAFLSI